MDSRNPVEARLYELRETPELFRWRGVARIPYSLFNL
jgi:hypothetical protein